MNCPKCSGDIWDNSEKVAGGWKGPLKKCKAECGWIVWAPKGAKAANGGTPAAPTQPKRTDMELVELYTDSLRHVIGLAKATNAQKDPVVVFTGTDVAAMAATVFIARSR